ncbi:MAG TPA: polysaccharide export protein, partial [bacterium]|nr:polysaccharide export protein [bacterium]
MKKTFKFTLSLLIILFISFSPASTYAQKFNLVPISSNNESMKDMKQQLQFFRFNRNYDNILSKEQPQPTEQRLQSETRSIQSQLPPPKESLSEFEQYISETIDITEEEFKILQKYKIFFVQTIQPAPYGMIKVPVRITRKPEFEKERMQQKDEILVNAGFLVGVEEEISTAFKIMGIKSPLTVTTGIRQFGYDLFRDPSSLFRPDINVPVGPGYVLGPGDEVRITVWGKIEGSWNVTVNRDGSISLPKIGVIGVSGLTFQEFKNILNKEFLKYYTGFEMNVSMGALRSISVYIVGNALKPGAYTISSLSTLVSALFKAGGPGKNGTMRDIQLKRNGQTIMHFDMYDFLLTGDKSKDIRLMPEDVIFIPPVGHQAAIAGSVINPAIYELKEETSVSKLIEIAGGLSDIAFKGRIQITRIIDKSRQTVFESNLDKIKDKDIILQSGDIVKVFQVVQDKKVVWLTGAVNKAGEYGFSKGLTVKDLITMAGGLKFYAYTKEAELTRIHISNEGPKTEKIIIALDKVLEESSGSTILLKENDYLFIRTIPNWKFYQIVFIDGEVNFPGAYIIKKGEKLSSLIERAGGYTDKAYIRGA